MTKVVSRNHFGSISEMGYKKTKLEEHVAVRMNFRLINKDENTDTTCEVIHHMRVPTFTEREAHQREIAKVRGRKVMSNVAEANWHLWLKCVISVEGYDDLPQNGDWKMYFSDGVERIHADEAVARLLESFESQETEVEKKFVQSSGQ
jgi:hypothetical protein